MNNLDKILLENVKNGRKNLIIYITAGYPDLDSTVEIVQELAKSGVDVVELGVPFSDPLADGPTIQFSSAKALEQKVNLKKVFLTVDKIRKKTSIPLVLMTYINPIIKYQPQRFFTDCAKHQVEGVIIPDIILEEGGEFENLAKKNNVDLIYLAALTTPLKRLEKIAQRSKGFLYFVSLVGVTGVRKSLSKELIEHLEKAKKVSGVPVCCGFGISTPQQARIVGQHSAGIIIGSAIIELIRKSRGNDFLNKIKEFVMKVRRELDAIEK